MDERLKIVSNAIDKTFDAIDKTFDAAEQTIEALRAENEKMRAIISDLTDGDPCSYDHHGYCQAHFWLKTDPICPQARIKALSEQH